MASEGAAQAERAISAPAAVVFNTATDPDRLGAWLPRPLRDTGADRLAGQDDGGPGDGGPDDGGDGGPRGSVEPDIGVRDGGRDDADRLRARWSNAGWLADLTVIEVAGGGARVRLELRADPPHDGLAAIADESLASLAGAVADNFTAG